MSATFWKTFELAISVLENILLIGFCMDFMHLTLSRIATLDSLVAFFILLMAALFLKLLKMAAEERWPIIVHDCCNRTKFARDLNLRAKEGGWFGASAYASEFPQLPYGRFLPVLRDENFKFLREEPLPQGYRPGDAVLF